MGLGWFSTHYNHFYGYGNKGRVLWLFLQNMYAHMHTYVCMCVYTRVFLCVFLCTKQSHESVPTAFSLQSKPSAAAGSTPALPVP